MGVLKIVLTVIFILVCIALTVIVLMQEGKSAGLGAISGMAETYWGKNKGRSIEGKLEKFTKYLAIGFIVLAIVLNFNFDRTSADTTDTSGSDASVTVTAAPADADSTDDAAGEEDGAASSDEADGASGEDTGSTDTTDSDGADAGTADDTAADGAADAE